MALDYKHLRVPTRRRAQTLSKLGSLLASTSWPLVRRRPDRDREQTIDLRPFLMNAELTDEGVLRARLQGTVLTARLAPEELLECLGLRDLLDQGAVLARTHVELATDDRTVVLSARGDGAEIPPDDAR